MWKNRFMFREVYYTKNDPAAVFISEFEEIEAVTSCVNSLHYLRVYVKPFIDDFG